MVHYLYKQKTHVKTVNMKLKFKIFENIRKNALRSMLFKIENKLKHTSLILVFYQLVQVLPEIL